MLRSVCQPPSTRSGGVTQCPHVSGAHGCVRRALKSPASPPNQARGARARSHLQLRAMQPRPVCRHAAGMQRPQYPPCCQCSGFQSKGAAGSSPARHAAAPAGEPLAACGGVKRKTARQGSANRAVYVYVRRGSHTNRPRTTLSRWEEARGGWARARLGAWRRRQHWLGAAAARYAAAAKRPQNGVLSRGRACGPHASVPGSTCRPPAAKPGPITGERRAVTGAQARTRRGTAQPRATTLHEHSTC